MKYNFVLFFLINSVVLFAQKKVSKQFQTLANEVNVYTAGLDNLVIENSNSEFVEVYLYAESYDNQLIKIEEDTKEVNIKFAFEGAETREVIFRKFITKRLQRANAIVKVPKGKKVFVFGENIDLESKNFTDDLAIYIENGIVKLNKINANTTLNLYSGNVYASIKNSNIDVNSGTGEIKVDSIFYRKKYQKVSLKNKNDFKVLTIKANIFLTNQ